MFKRKRALLIACSTILLCLALIVGGTYALFTDSARVTNHLRAGFMDVTLTRTTYTHKVLDPQTGYLTERVAEGDERNVDFSGVTSENLFGLTMEDDAATAYDDRDLMVPGVSYRSEMKLTNNGTVAFNYTINIVYNVTDANGNQSDSKFAEQLYVTLWAPQTNEDGSVKVDENGNTVWEEEALTGAYLPQLAGGFNLETNADLKGILTVEEGQERVFAVQVEFVDQLTNNDANRDPDDGTAERNVYFDLVINAEQQTEAPTP